MPQPLVSRRTTPARFTLLHYARGLAP
jgi:hypothetical protein